MKLKFNPRLMLAFFTLMGLMMLAGVGLYGLLWLSLNFGVWVMFVFAVFAFICIGLCFGFSEEIGKRLSHLTDWFFLPDDMRKKKREREERYY